MKKRKNIEYEEMNITFKHHRYGDQWHTLRELIFAGSNFCGSQL